MGEQRCVFAHPGRNGDDDDEVSHSIMNVCGEEKKKSSLHTFITLHFFFKIFKNLLAQRLFPL